MKECKKKRQRHHARRRARQRFDMDQDDLDYFTSIIQQGKATCIEKQSNRVSVFEFDHQGETISVVYDKKRSQIVTVMSKYL